VVITLFLRGHPPNAGNIVPLLFANAIPVGIGALTSRRVRRNTIERWSERRTSAREQMRMRDELRYAREVQLSMLPEAAPVLDWADIAGISIPATEVGGDYFDYIDVDGALAVICGDVAGHGMASGITLSALRGGITLLRREFLHPAAVLERLQEVVTESSRKRTLVTLAAVLFDPRRRVATVANAGHPPILIRRTSGLVDSIELFGPPLGVRRNEPVPEREVPFGAGDIFLLHSDGVYETTNAAGDQYGLDRLSALLASLHGSAAEVRDGVLRSVAEFRGTAAQQDDVTVVVIRIASV
jgi:phosphoserine phosphatase RsbU/P